MMVISSHKRGESVEVGNRRIGPGLIFERLWQETGCRQVIEKLLSGRRFDFPVERAIFLMVLHRLFDPGSDRQADRWRQEYRIEGVEELQLHHLYRAMAWLGEDLPMGEQCSMNRFAPRSTKDLIAEELFARPRDLFSGLELVFFDTTSIYSRATGARRWGSGATPRTIVRT
ncbi:MAG: hypothetical protein ACUVS3_16775 [Thermodesulfobacteriota bacterium]